MANYLQHAHLSCLLSQQRTVCAYVVPNNTLPLDAARFGFLQLGSACPGDVTSHRL
jgi:hypothetical protein